MTISTLDLLGREVVDEANADDEISIQVEMGLTQREWFEYVTRVPHGKLPMGILCKVKRTAAGNLIVNIRSSLLYPEDNDVPLTLNFNGGAWYLKGLEHKERIDELYRTKKSPKRYKGARPF